MQGVKTTLTGTNLLTIRNPVETERPNSSLPIRNLTGGVTSSLRRQTPIADRRIRTPSHKLAQKPVLSMNSQSARNVQNRTVSPGPSDSEEEEEMDAAEEETQKLEEQETVEQRLKDLANMMNPDELGFFRTFKPPPLSLELDSSQAQNQAQTQTHSELTESVRREDSVAGTSESNATSPQGSIPSIPSPHNELRSPTTSSVLSSVQATTTLPRNQSRSPRLPQSPRRMTQISKRGGAPSRNVQHANSQGSATSSFSDISDAPSVSASALESALLSNLRGGLYVIHSLKGDAETQCITALRLREARSVLWVVEMDNANFITICIIILQTNTLHSIPEIVKWNLMYLHVYRNGIKHSPQKKTLQSNNRKKL